MALFNELMVSVYLYLMLCLADFHGENLVRDQIGLALLALVIFTVFVNILKAIWTHAHLLKFKKCREYFKKKRA